MLLFNGVKTFRGIGLNAVHTGVSTGYGSGRTRGRKCMWIRGTVTINKLNAMNVNTSDA